MKNKEDNFRIDAVWYDGLGTVISAYIGIQINKVNHYWLDCEWYLDCEW